MNLETNTDDMLRNGMENTTEPSQEEQACGLRAMAMPQTWLEGDPE